MNKIDSQERLARDEFQPNRSSKAVLVRTSRRGPPLLLWGACLTILGFTGYLFGVLVAVPRRLLNLEALYGLNQSIVWYSGIPVVLGIALMLFELKFNFRKKRFSDPVYYMPVANRRVTVALTAFNDEASIGDSVVDFLGHPDVERVIVVSNNSSDKTFENAVEAGAITINEERAGYGHCVHRCLTEAVKFSDTELVLLCEGDMTFRAYDIEKFLAYVPHADIVNGTRTSETLRQIHTQLSTFIFYGNVFVGKLLEAKHLGRVTLTDVGTTYKLCRRSILPRLLDEVNPEINLEFNAHFVDVAVGTGHTLVECPVTFHARVGASKGGNVNNLTGFLVGLRMVRGIIAGWKSRHEQPAAPCK